MASVEVDQVTFSYPVYDIGGRSLKVSMMHQFGGRSESGVVKVRALSDISLSLKTGDRLGLIGRNGAGKSTLLRVLAGVMHPQQGSVKIDGRVVPLIGRAIGMQPDLTGMQNIELPMRLLGDKEAEIKRGKREIPDWTGIGDFIHLPLRTYSDGMRARLMFAICTAVRGDVLIMDEWLSAGDMEFATAATIRLQEMLSETGIVVISTHSVEMLRTLCNIICWMERGQVVMIGEPEVVIPAYLSGIRQRGVDDRIVIAAE